MSLDLFTGPQLRDAALAQSKRGRETRIEMVREALRPMRWYEGTTDTLTADDVWVVAQALGFTDGDTRWLGSILRSWRLVENTGQYTPSRRKVNHARPVPIFRWK